MTEYWVSKARHWCEYCRIFINGDKQSIAFHEMGKKHKEIVEMSLKDMRKRGRERKKDSSELERELAKIERAANREFMEKDATAHMRAASAAAAVPAHVPADRAARLAELEARISADKLARAAATAAAGEQLPPGWRAMTNPDGKVYYTHDVSGAVQWEPPGGGGGASSSSCCVACSSDSAAASGVGAAADAGAQSADGWQTGWTDEGIQYYYNTARGITQWEPPAGFEVGLAVEDGGGGGGDAPHADAAGSSRAAYEHAAAEHADEGGGGGGASAAADPDRLSGTPLEVSAAEASGESYDANTGLGSWTVVEEETMPEGGWGYDGANPREKRQRVSWAVSRVEIEQEESVDKLTELKAKLPVSEEMQAALQRNADAEAAAAAAAEAAAAPAVFAKRKGKANIRKKE